MEKRSVTVLVAVGVLALSTLACSTPWMRGSGHVVEDARAVGDLTGVALMTIGTVHIEVGDEESLRVEAEDNLLPYFETQVTHGVLEIRSPDGFLPIPTEPVNFYLTVKSLDTLMLAGSGAIEAPALEARQFSLDVSGSGDIEVDALEASRVSATVSGSGDITLQELNAGEFEVRITGSGGIDVAGGEVENQAVTISGSGTYRAGDLESGEASAHLSGSGSAMVQVRDRLDAHISGSGSVRFTGNPSVESRVSGSGRVQRIGE